ncbi:TetR/AcrR family transcriptional regulator [Sinomonas sp. ASV322]|uniref:TetR/AcrR family transcriptional regulator n=1 Tax=Sinomonas sp. ASV322 TaxID=3041920 RepID=UPI0027DE65AE|nr:TetR/AcrR family transcriptional regulator [Sinomonas sp. ASV322]MDQ4503889.1 TetR/AcrR family transcriptional regulator [Sinomonas sp. ASV322]
MPASPRAKARAQTMTDILRLGREHLATHGAAALSLRAIARELGLVSSAVYRYVASRDELLTLLVIDAYSDLGNAVDAAVDRVASSHPTDYRAQFTALGIAVREWALREPARYGLIFGTPVPGYAAPTERTTAPGTRVVVRLIGIFDAAWRAGNRPNDGGRPVSGRLAEDIARIRGEGELSVGDEAIATGVLVWTSLFGAVTFEVFGQYGPGTFTDLEQLFRRSLDLLADLGGLG